MDGEEKGPRSRLQAMTDGEFIAAWNCFFGGPPAAMIDREAMIDLMFDEGPATLVCRIGKPAQGRVMCEALSGTLPRQA